MSDPVATTLVRAVADRLAAAGVEGARTDAELLVAHVLGVPRSRLLLAGTPDAAATDRLEGLVARRERREPLQHLLGTAVLGPVEVVVGPGVFVPRPETELVYSWALAALRPVASPQVADLCTGSGALALALAAARPDAVVHAVERDPDALAWTHRNVAGAAAQLEPGTGAVVVVAGDVTDPGLLADLDGTLDLVVANPPYVPAGSVVGPEVHHDPAVAVFAGDDGLDVLPGLVLTAARLLTPGGRFATEHDESHAAAVADLVRDAGFTDVTGHHDLAGRPRFTTATRAPGTRS